MRNHACFGCPERLNNKAIILLSIFMFGNMGLICPRLLSQVILSPNAYWNVTDVTHQTAPANLGTLQGPFGSPNYNGSGVPPAVTPWNYSYSGASSSTNETWLLQTKFNLPATFGSVYFTIACDDAAIITINGNLVVADFNELGTTWTTPQAIPGGVLHSGVNDLDVVISGNGNLINNGDILFWEPGSDNNDYFAMMLSSQDCMSFPTAAIQSADPSCSSQPLTLTAINAQENPAGTGCSGASVSQVMFYANDVPVGLATTASGPGTYTYTWANPPAGLYSITAVVTDSTGASTTSAPVTQIIGDTPTVSITSPLNPGNQYAPYVACSSSLPISITANASENQGTYCNGATISSVAYYANGELIGSSTSAGTQYQYNWSPPPGNYTLVSVATDTAGASVLSSPEEVVVSESFPVIASSISPSGACEPSGFTKEESDDESPACDDATVSIYHWYFQGNYFTTTNPESTGPGAYNAYIIGTDTDGDIATSTPTAITIGNFPETSLTSWFYNPGGNNNLVTAGLQSPVYGTEFFSPTSIPLSCQVQEVVNCNPSEPPTLSSVSFQITNNVSGAHEGTVPVPASEFTVPDPSFPKVYSASGSWEPSALPPGIYSVAATAADSAGNPCETSLPTEFIVEGAIASGTMPADVYAQTATLLTNGNLLIVGGNSSTTGIQSKSEAESILSGTFAPYAPVIPRAYHTATLLTNGQVLIAGGLGTNGPLSSSQQSTNSNWSTVGSLQTARYSHTATLLTNGQVLVAGGIGAAGTALPSWELYLPGVRGWNSIDSLGPMNQPRYCHTATLLPDGQVLVAGGEDGGPLPNAELFNVATGTWTVTGSLQNARYSHTATLLPNGMVLVAGGYGATGAVDIAELYNPATGQWSATGSMVTGRYYHTATLLDDGAVLVTGGLSGTTLSHTELSSMEIYDPNTGLWGSFGQMTLARAQHTATLGPLSDRGVVIITGGWNGPKKVSQSSTELIFP